MDREVTMNEIRQTALLVIDPQLDFFPGYKFPLWNTEEVLRGILRAIDLANDRNYLVLLITHSVDPAVESVPFFLKGSLGAQVHPGIRGIDPLAPVIEKPYADAFYKTDLEHILDSFKVTDLMICGMMTQNCVTYTALSPVAAKYRVNVLSDACTTVNELLNSIALHSLATRVNVLPVAEAFH